MSINDAHASRKRRLPMLSARDLTQRDLTKLVGARAPWLGPITEAVQLGRCKLAIVPPWFGPFHPPDPYNAIALILDDAQHAYGPRAFDAQSVQSLLVQADAISLIGCTPITAIYHNAATIACAGGFVALVETRLEFEAAWFRIVEPHRSHAAVLAALCRAEGVA